MLQRPGPALGFCQYLTNAQLQMKLSGPQSNWEDISWCWRGDGQTEALKGEQNSDRQRLSGPVNGASGTPKVLLRGRDLLKKEALLLEEGLEPRFWG